MLPCSDIMQCPCLVTTFFQQSVVLGFQLCLPDQHAVNVVSVHIMVAISRALVIFSAWSLLIWDSWSHESIQSEVPVSLHLVLFTHIVLSK